MHGWRRRVVIALIITVLTAIALHSPALAQGSGPENEAVEAVKEELGRAINFAWTLIAAFLVFFMQAGFAM
ncbi:ammonium transporter [Thermoflexus hugenholtzii]|uniref:Ammonium transporter, Amt family n=1 Tax=Thermoflexus hugenholtzii JAD2 TaxID=877466 RepID=A0A212RK62_9CHLR|nr:ammonium transporter [Thermoflexus hugenholtzii]SNB72847.1 ammonium transporter, Amt family [Thermoflexus hugenholtzii JAD2]